MQLYAERHVAAGGSWRKRNRREMKVNVERTGKEEEGRRGKGVAGMKQGKQGKCRQRQKWEEGGMEERHHRQADNGILIRIAFRLERNCELQRGGEGHFGNRNENGMRMRREGKREVRC